MKCNNCPACQNIYGNYEYPEYGCKLFDERECRVNNNGEDYCLHRHTTIERMLEEIAKEEIHF